MSQTDVSYSCGSCGYPLNLKSSGRITSGTSPGYLKSIGRGYISFGSIDLSRFTQVDEMNCIPPIFCGSQGSKTKLLCRKCGILIGYGYGESSVLCGLSDPTSSTFYRKVMVKIRALQPSEDSEQSSDHIENGS